MITTELIVVAVATLILGLVLGYVLRLALARRLRNVAERSAEEILETAEQDAQRIRRDAELAARDEVYRLKEVQEKEAEEMKKELRQQDRRLQRREETLDEKLENLTRKESKLEGLEDDLTTRKEDLERRREDLGGVLTQQREKLLAISTLSEKEAKEIVLEEVEAELDQEIGEIVQRSTEKAKEEADRRARDIVVTAIQRTAADHSSESTVSIVDLPNDDMKGRIIGREGRNIRAFEKATGVDVIVDDTPGVVVVSAFDSVRRETARRALKRLVADGRIHPTRIEDVVTETQREMDEVLREAGRKAVQECDVSRVHPKLVDLLGRLKFRTSYGQNVLQHSIEVSNLCGVMAGELGLDIKVAKRAGLLHDIGKSIDHEMEGGHPLVGADIARRCGESKEVVNAIAAHHEDVAKETVISVLVQAGDAISAARPGARRESLERYIKRLERLEEVATGFDGVVEAYAIQAGREVRVIVNPGRVTDQVSVKMCRDIAQKIEQELTYPGEVKVTVVRETRAVDYAR
jgi:ribonucrease Y